MSDRDLLLQAAAHLREDVDFNRSWTDGRRASGLGEAYDRRRLEVAEERERWAEAIERAAAEQQK